MPTSAASRLKASTRPDGGGVVGLVVNSYGSPVRSQRSGYSSTEDRRASGWEMLSLASKISSLTRVQGTWTIPILGQKGLHEGEDFLTLYEAAVGITQRRQSIVEGRYWSIVQGRHCRHLVGREWWGQKW